ncbi:Asp/Glu/hydantoin racemase [Pseudobutyrivibrio sp. C4]|uniref:aspartate/glutamate racemase family protein n=1 Tax=Pseudobutyrivibrio sp. C4 TaxID=1520803 RepID=UPI0008AEBAAA|nr:aspartate/glutamate racemase family protein [Pseudobutyrivibrio sp. C4]SES78394.1 Asp/Glu/hydantoin racemase [Pseudobutyrivibrio sp. C4]
MKVGLVYTSTTPELIELVEEEVKKQLGEDVELYSIQDPSILADTRDAGYVTTNAAARLITMYMQAAQEGCDAIINLCSSVGEVADSAQDVANYIGVPIVRVDEEMCRDAVRSGTRVGVMATLPTTLEPTKNTIKRMSRECGKHVELVDCLVEGAFGLNQEEFKQRMADSAKQIVDKVDVIVFAQGSMAYCEEYIENLLGVKVVSSPRFGAKELKKALIKKGCIAE